MASKISEIFATVMSSQDAISDLINSKLINTHKYKISTAFEFLLFVTSMFF